MPEWCGFTTFRKKAVATSNVGTEPTPPTERSPNVGHMLQDQTWTNDHKDRVIGHALAGGSLTETQKRELARSNDPRAAEALGKAR